MPNNTYKSCYYLFILLPARFCNFQMQVFQIKLKYYCSKPMKLQKFLMQQCNSLCTRAVHGFKGAQFPLPPPPHPRLIVLCLFNPATVFLQERTFSTDKLPNQLGAYGLVGTFPNFTQSRYTIIIIYEVSAPFENTSTGKSYSGLKLCWDDETRSESSVITQVTVKYDQKTLQGGDKGQV